MLAPIFFVPIHSDLQKPNKQRAAAKADGDQAARFFESLFSGIKAFALSSATTPHPVPRAEIDAGNDRGGHFDPCSES